MNNILEVHVNPNPVADQIDFYIRENDAWVVNMTLETKDEGSRKPKAFSLDTMEAQALMDRLWKAGLRPTEGSGSAGALAATERHLRDLQKLAFPEDMDSLYNRMDTC